MKFLLDYYFGQFFQYFEKFKICKKIWQIDISQITEHTSSMQLDALLSFSHSWWLWPQHDDDHRTSSILKTQWSSSMLCKEAICAAFVVATAVVIWPPRNIWWPSSYGGGHQTFNMIISSRSLNVLHFFYTICQRYVYIRLCLFHLNAVISTSRVCIMTWLLMSLESWWQIGRSSKSAIRK